MDGDSIFIVYVVSTTILVLMATNSVFGQPNCIDDIQCTEGRFCEQSTFTCRACMDCSELNRRSLPNLEEDTCVKSDFDCGPCLENYTTTQWNSKCVVSEEEPFSIMFWFVCAAVALLIAHIGIFLHVIIHKNEYVIVSYCVTTKQPMSLQLNVRGHPLTKINIVLNTKHKK